MIGDQLEERAAAIADILAPYAWRGFTCRMLARQLVGAAERRSVAEFLAGIPGSKIGNHDPINPADADDDRVNALVGLLESQHWRSFRLDYLCRQMLAALDA